VIVEASLGLDRRATPWNFPMPALVYNGTLISERDEMLSLTDMWRAGKADASKRPGEWLRHTATIEFTEHIEAVMGDTHNGLITQERGGREGGGSTWAHWQIAMAYAKYLSPEFHAWCNEVVRAHMEGRSLTVQQATTVSVMPIEAVRELGRSIVEPIMERMDTNFAKTWGKQGDTEREVAVVKKEVITINDRLSVVEQAVKSNRKRPAPSVKLQIIDAAIALGGSCPCCRTAVIICEGVLSPFAELDHFYANSKADINHVWIICKPCHRDLTTGRVERSAREAEFKSFHAQRKRLPHKQGKLLLD
jgi:hypothetical protein